MHIGSAIRENKRFLVFFTLSISAYKLFFFQLFHKNSPPPSPNPTPSSSSITFYPHLIFFLLNFLVPLLPCEITRKSFLAITVWWESWDLAVCTPGPVPGDKFDTGPSEWPADVHGFLTTAETSNSRNPTDLSPFSSSFPHPPDFETTHVVFASRHLSLKLSSLQQCDPGVAGSVHNSLIGMEIRWWFRIITSSFWLIACSGHGG